MRTIPILFSAPMVRAILDGTKTQTRRVIHPQPEHASPTWAFAEGDEGHSGTGWYCAEKDYPEEGSFFYRCPYGAVGDRLWVRETWYCDHYELLEGPYKEVENARENLYYRADDPRGDITNLIPECDLDGGSPNVWKPSIHMPRWASRILLEVTDVRVQRVQEISDEDICAEGMSKELLESLILQVARRHKVRGEHWIRGLDESVSYCERCAEKEVARQRKADPTLEIDVDGGWGIEGDSIPRCETCGVTLDNCLTDYGKNQELKHFADNGICLRHSSDCWGLNEAITNLTWDSPFIYGCRDYEVKERLENQHLLHTIAWRTVWDSINAKRGFGWKENPWVWVVTFKKVEAAK